MKRLELKINESLNGRTMNVRNQITQNIYFISVVFLLSLIQRSVCLFFVTYLLDVSNQTSLY
jgi:hypothetical protein